MTVPEDHGVGIWESSAQPSEPAPGRACVVRDHDPGLAELELADGRERPPKLGLVNVAADGVDGRPESPKGAQCGHRADVACIEDRSELAISSTQRSGMLLRPFGRWVSEMIAINGSAQATPAVACAQHRRGFFVERSCELQAAGPAGFLLK